MRIAERQPLAGELLRDASGRYFLAPEEVCRGGGMYSIPVHNLSARAKVQFTNRIVRLTGIFEDGIGVTAGDIAPEGEPPDPPGAGDRCPPSRS